MKFSHADVLIPDTEGITPLRRAQMNMKNHVDGKDFGMQYLKLHERALCLDAARELIAVLARAEEQQKALLAAEMSELGEALAGAGVGE